MWSTIMNWLGFGKMQVLLWKFSDPLKKSDPVITGAVLFKSSKDVKVKSLEVKVVEEYTWTEGEGDDKKTRSETTTLGSFKFPDRDPGIGYPHEIKGGAQAEQPFEVHVAVNETLQNHGTSTVGKMLDFTSSDKIVYYLVAEAAVEGQTWASTAKEKLKIAE